MSEEMDIILLKPDQPWFFLKKEFLKQFNQLFFMK
ncbi:uncharacterized protein METZ01_LOCUS305089, partial [marine metagenome]